MLSNKQLSARDLKHVWHPCTQMKDHESLAPIPIKSGKGVWLEDFDGNRYIDAVSSWWVNLFGHSNPKINAALREQAESLEHVILAGFTHEPVVKLSEQLCGVAPPGLTKCFYADNGSSAVEVTIKMSYHYWQNIGRTKKSRFVNISNSYHGETLGALAMGDVPLYKETYSELMQPVITVPGPDCFERESGESWEEYSRRRFELMEQTLQKHAEEICAVIIEPLVQCAGSMRMYHPIYLKMLREACDRYDIHLIADEVAVGFGRTGTLFACEQADITPDFMCLSKGLTAGYLPLSVVMTTEKVYEAFYDSYETLRAFLHSHSYTGNPLGCSVALATLKMFAEESVLERNKKTAQYMADAIAHFNDHPNVAEVRQTGMILAVEMVQDKQTRTPFPWQERRGLRVFKYALKNQAMLRPLGNVIYFMPPYVINEDEIDHLAKVAWEGLQLAVE